MPFSCWQCHQRFEFQDQIEHHEIEAEPLTHSGSSNIELDTSTENISQEHFSEQQITSPSRNHEIDAFPTHIMNDGFPSELLLDEMQIDHTDESSSSSGNEDDMIQPNGNPEINITSQLSPRNFNQSESIDHTSLKEYVMNRENKINSFLSNSVSKLQEKCDYSDILTLWQTYEIEEINWGQYTKETSIYAAEKMEIDTFAVELILKSGSLDYMPIILSKEDTLFAAISVILIAQEYLNIELRLSTFLALIKHQSKITFYARSKGLHLIEFDYEKELINCATHGNPQSSCHLLGICWAMTNPQLMKH